MKRKASLQKKLSLEKGVVASLSAGQQHSLQGGRVATRVICNSFRPCSTWVDGTICISFPTPTIVCL
ncbi:class I lanthipeptide [Chitinophaga sp.]|uniref:class I lanthipeptide n=1 Tax=Chitinophaga sp. TaxID=1869181 RepID=UPI0039C87103